MDEILSFVDANIDKKGVAGIGIVIINGSKRKEYALFTKCRTINAAEIFAIHLASILTHGQALVYTDSQTALSYIKGEIKDKPRTREQYLNHLECKYWAYQVKKNKGVRVEKVKAHTNRRNLHAGNNKLADTLAMLGQLKYYENARAVVKKENKSMIKPQIQFCRKKGAQKADRIL